MADFHFAPRGPLQFPLVSGQPASQIGVDFYVGNMRDGNSFLRTLGTPLVNRNASLMDQAAFYWEKSKRSFRAPKRYEVWCPQTVCFQTDDVRTPTVHPGNGEEAKVE